MFHRGRVTLRLMAASSLGALLLLGAGPAQALSIAGGDGSHETLMAIPGDAPSLMPIPDDGHAPARAADDHAGDDMADMDAHGRSSNMPSVATPDAEQRRVVIGGFAVVNLLVLAAAGSLRRAGRGRGSRPATRGATPARAPRSTSTTDGGAA